MIGYSSVQQDRATLGFTVVQNNGGSTTSWTGQCQFCDGQEVLKTTWIKSKEVNHCWEMKYANRSVYLFLSGKKINDVLFSSKRAEKSSKCISFLEARGGETERRTIFALVSPSKTTNFLEREA